MRAQLLNARYEQEYNVWGMKSNHTLWPDVKSWICLCIGKHAMHMNYGQVLNGLEHIIIISTVMFIMGVACMIMHDVCAST